MKIKIFFNSLTKSITNLSYYKEIAKAKLSFSFKYLFFLFYLISLLGSLVFAILISTSVLPQVPGFVSNFKTNATAFFPAKLVVTVKDGIVSTNQKEPFTVNQFVTINTQADPSKIIDYKTFALITKDSLAIVDQNNSYRVYPLEKDTNLLVDKNSYDKVIDQILPYLKYLQAGLIGLIVLSVLVWPIIVALILFIIQLIYLSILSPIFFGLTKLMKKDLKYAKIYQLSIHASSLPILLRFIISSLNFQMPIFLGTAILIIFMILIINQF